MRITLVFLFIFTNLAFANDCRESIVAKCNSLQIVHQLCGGEPGSFVQDRYSLIDEDGQKLSFYLKDGLLTSSMWNSKRHMSYGLRVEEKLDGSSTYSLTPTSAKAQALSCETLNQKKDSTQTANAPNDNGPAAAR